MKKVLFVLALVTAFVYAADSYLLEGTAGGGAGTDDRLQYDDGSAAWVTAGVPYYGTWFDVADFYPSGMGIYCGFAEWWTYHWDAYPWDTDLVSLELYNGDVFGPAVQIAQDEATALHYAPVIVTYATPVVAEQNFWMILNTTVYSAVTAPHVLSDASGNFTGEDHSFISDDFILWEPRNIGGSPVDHLFRADGVIILTLENESWGAIKGLFR